MIEVRLRATPNLGFLLDVLIDHHSSVKERFKQEGKTLPPAVKALALIDTGAAVCGVKREVIEALRLPSPAGEEQLIATPGQNLRTRVYFGSVSAEGQPRLAASYVRFVEFGMQTPFHVILGLPVLLAWNFEYRRDKGELRLWLPR